MKQITILLFTLFCIVGCQDKPSPVDPSQRTVLVYLVADNSLSKYAVTNITKMQGAYDPVYGTRLLVFYNEMGGKCSLLEIREGQKSVAEAIVLKDYGKINPCLPATINRVLEDTRAFAPAKIGYSMILWSHGSGWLPRDMHPAKIAPNPNAAGATKLTVGVGGNAAENSADNPLGYSFGDGLYSYKSTFEINELVAAVPSDMVFDYVAFDACYMASVEAAYQFRHKTRYFIASAAEILANGFPYDKAIPSILRGDAASISKAFYDYYNIQSGVYQSATIATVDCSKLEAVAAELKNLVVGGGMLRGGQQFGRNLGSGANYRNLFYDLSDMVHQTWGQTPAFDAAMAQAIVYQGATPMLFEGDYYGDITVNSHCGLTAYLPRLSQPQTLAIFNKDYDWAKDTALSNLAQ